MAAENLYDNIGIQVLDDVGNDGLAMKVTRGRESISSFSNFAIFAFRATKSER
jgi:hypothetical protein